MPKFDEANLEEAIIAYLQQNQDYQLSYGSQLDRSSKDTIIDVDLTRYLLISYPDLIFLVNSWVLFMSQKWTAYYQ